MGNIFDITAVRAKSSRILRQWQFGYCEIFVTPQLRMVCVLDVPPNMTTKGVWKLDNPMDRASEGIRSHADATRQY